MESKLIAWRLLLLGSLFVFPQLLGILLYFRLSRAPRWLAALAAMLAPAIIFVWLAPILLFEGLRKADATRPVCGMPALGGILILFAGTTIHLVLGLISLLAQRTFRNQTRQSNRE